MSDHDEIAVLAKAKQNFREQGQGDRMWERSTASHAGITSDVFYLTEQERSEYLARARRDLSSANDI